MELNLGHVHTVQSILEEREIDCIVSGDLALLYHNVDRVLHVGAWRVIAN